MKKLFKKKWLADTAKTIILVVIILLCYVGINIGVQKLELTDIDVTKEKRYTISDESKEKVKQVNEQVNIYFFGYDQNNTTVDLAKQYQKENDKIKVEVVNLNDRPDLVSKYQVSQNDTAIIVESEKGEKILTQSDLYTYDYTTYEEIDVTEQKLTNAIGLVTIKEKPVIYFLTGHDEYGINSHLTLLNAYLTNEVNDVKELNLLIKNEIPRGLFCSSNSITTKRFYGF